MTSNRWMLLDKRLSRLTRNVGKNKVNRSVTFPITADAMIPQLANALGMNCNEAGRLAFVHFFESRLGKAKTFAFKVACQIKADFIADCKTLISIFKPDAPFEEKQAAFEASLKAQREEQLLAVANADALVADMLKLNEKGEFEPSKE